MVHKCWRCGRFISRDEKRSYCSDCFWDFYQMVGTVPDDTIPRDVLKEWRYQQAKRAKEIAQYEADLREGNV